MPENQIPPDVVPTAQTRAEVIALLDQQRGRTITARTVEPVEDVNGDMIGLDIRTLCGLFTGYFPTPTGGNHD